MTVMGSSWHRRYLYIKIVNKLSSNVNSIYNDEDA